MLELWFRRHLDLVSPHRGEPARDQQIALPDME